MRICVFEDQGVALLDPLILTRAAFDLRCGAATLLEYQFRHFAASEKGAVVRPTLAELCRAAHPELAVNDQAWLRSGPTVLVNARWLPPVDSTADVTTSHVGLVGDQVAYAILPADRLSDLPLTGLDDWLVECIKKLPQRQANGQIITYPWDLVEQNAAVLSQGIPPGLRLAPTRCPSGAAVMGPEERLFIAPSAQVEPFVLLDTRTGPIYIDRAAQVKAFSRLTGPCYVGPETWVLAAQVTHSTLGPVCRIGGEVENSIVHGYSNKAHEGFLGHSYVGEWVNLAAGTQVSDLRSDYQPISMPVAGAVVPTGLTKIGAFFGDHTKTGINTLINTGTSTGIFCQIFPSNLLPPRVMSSFCSFARGQLQEGPQLSQLLATAAIMMGRRGVPLTNTHADFFRRLFEETAEQRQRVLRASAGRGPGA